MKNIKMFKENGVLTSSGVLITIIIVLIIIIFGETQINFGNIITLIAFIILSVLCGIQFEKYRKYGELNEN